MSQWSANTAVLIVSTNGFLNAYLVQICWPGQKWRVHISSLTELLLIVHLHVPICPTVLILVLAFVILSAVCLLVFPGLILF